MVENPSFAVLVRFLSMTKILLIVGDLTVNTKQPTVQSSWPILVVVE